MSKISVSVKETQIMDIIYTFDDILICFFIK